MADSSYVILDTKSFDEFINQRESLLQRYDDIKNDYENIRKTLLYNWKGKGAEAFDEDAVNISKNIGGIYDILKTMCDTLIDCREIFDRCDKSLGEYNENPNS